MNSFSEVIFSLLLLPVLLALSAFFSCAETALFSLTPDAARRLRSARHSEELLNIFYKDPSALLSAILLGNLFVNILFFCTGAAVIGRMAEAHGEWVEALGGIGILLAVILFGEIIPKALGITLAAGIVRITAVPLQVWFVFTRPLRRLISGLLDWIRLGADRPLAGADLTSGELRELLDAVRHEPGFGVPEKEIFEDIVNLSEVRAREVMVPRVSVLRCPLAADWPEILRTAVRQEYSCIVVYRENDNDLIGYLHVRELFHIDDTTQVESLIKPLPFIPETKRVDILLREFLAAGWQIAAVVDEYGGFSGIVTMADLFAEVVGGLESETGEEIEKLDETTYRLSGQLSIRAWQDLLTGILPGYEIGSPAFDTLGGFITSLLGRIANPNDRVMIRNLRLTVESMHHSRIETVLLHLNQPEEML